MQYLEETYKRQQAKINSHQEKQSYKQIHIPVAISLLRHIMNNPRRINLGKLYST